MIKINRLREAVPQILEADNASVYGEKQLAIKHFEQDRLDKASFSVKFKVYSDKTVKEALLRLFYNKCAYCEGQFKPHHYGQIDHWRPHGGVKGCAHHNGYYWLASEWGNLYLSCQTCNHSKLHQFPIRSNSNYALCSMDLLNREHPLLLDPCNDNPRLHLNFNQDGIVEGLTDVGKSSIHVYKLNRSDLALDRGKQLGVVLSYLNSMLSLYKSVAKAHHYKDIDEVRRLKSEFDKKIDEIKPFLSEKSEYLGMVLDGVERFLTEQDNLVISKKLRPLIEPLGNKLAVGA